MKNKESIPKGEYCYCGMEVIDSNTSTPVIKVKCCPYWKFKTINGVEVNWCEFLDKGGLPNKEIDFQKLVDVYGSEDNVYDELSLSLLFDQVKECGENLMSDEELRKWLQSK